MNELLTQTYYNNTLQAWFIGLGIIVASIVFAKAVYWIFSRVGPQILILTKISVF